MTVAEKEQDKFKFTQLFNIELKKGVAKEREVKFVKIGQYEVRFYMDNGFLNQHITLYNMQTLVSEVVINTKDNVSIGSYMCMAYDVMNSFITLAISKSSLKDVIESAKVYGYEE